MKNKSLFFVAIMSLSTIFLTSYGCQRVDSADLQVEATKQAFAETVKQKEAEIEDLNKKIIQLENEIDKAPVISSYNYSYYPHYSADKGIFYKIILLTTISDPIVTGVEGDIAGQYLEFILESVELSPVRVIGSQFFPYEEGKSSIPANLKVGTQVTLDDMEYQGDVHVGG